MNVLFIILFVVRYAGVNDAALPHHDFERDTGPKRYPHPSGKVDKKCLFDVQTLEEF